MLNDDFDIEIRVCFWQEVEILFDILKEGLEVNDFIFFVDEEGLLFFDIDLVFDEKKVIKDDTKGKPIEEKFVEIGVFEDAEIDFFFHEEKEKRMRVIESERSPKFFRLLKLAIKLFFLIILEDENAGKIDEFGGDDEIIFILSDFEQNILGFDIEMRETR